MGKNVTKLSTDNLLVQNETVRFDLNVNPLGIPESVTQAINSNISGLTEYPDTEYKRLKESISGYCGADADHIMIAGSSFEFIKLLVEYVRPRKSLLITPGAHRYERVLKLSGCEIIRYELDAENDFALDIADYISNLNEELDMVFISNPNAATSGVIDRESLGFIAKICAGNEIFLVVDEEYMDFARDKNSCTSIPLITEYDNMAVLRNTSKFFAIPGLRLSYMLTANDIFKKTMEIAGFPYAINRLAEMAGIDMFLDASYITKSESLIATERNLVYSALSSRKTIKLYKPDANFILVKLLKKNLYAGEVREYCISQGLYIRDCSDIEGLGNNFIRFCFMNPKQDDLLVNTILEIV